MNELEQVRGIDIMGAKGWDEEDKLIAFMAIFHPERGPMYKIHARDFMKENT